MRSPRLRDTLLWLAAMAPGLIFGRYLRQCFAPPQAPPLYSASVQQVVSPVHRDPAKDKGSVILPEAEGPGGAESVLRVPPGAMLRIEVELMDGVTLNKNECRLLGLDEEQIRRLSQVVAESIERMRAREKAAVRVLPSDGPDQLMYIPPADPVVAEQEWQEMTAMVREIAGPELQDLLHYRLTDGYSPTRFSNAGTGMLNVLTAGFGTMHQFIRVTTLPDGSQSYKVTDLLPATLKAMPVDGSVFAKIGKSIGFDGVRTYDSVKDFGRISHLPSP